MAGRGKRARKRKLASTREETSPSSEVARKAHQEVTQASTDAAGNANPGTSHLLRMSGSASSHEARPSDPKPNQAFGHLHVPTLPTSSSEEALILSSPAAPSATALWYECTDVLAIIFFNCLGLADVLQCRRVCKTWHQTLGDILHIRRKFCCLMHVETDDVFWLHPEDISMHVCPRIPSSICWKCALNFPVPEQYKECRLLASAHGLLCFQLDAGIFKRTLVPLMVVCNPVTGGHRTLPQLSRIDEVESVGMHVNLLQNTYTILVIGKSVSQPGNYFHNNGDPVNKPFYVSHVEIYCSKARSWTYSSHFITDGGVEKGRIAWWQGQFYWMIKKPGRSLHLLVYDLKKKEWIESKVDSFENESSGFMHSSCVRSPFVWKDSLVCKLPYNSRCKYWHVRPSSTKQQWTPLRFLKNSGLESMKKPTSMHVAAHLSEGSNGLHVCIFDPYSVAPMETPISSSQTYIVQRKRLLRAGPSFSFNPCFSCQV